MKLYTEDQIIDILQSGSFPYNDEELDEILSELTPIELPTDEDIDIYVKSHNYDDMFENLLEYGAKWMRDQIINQNK